MGRVTQAVAHVLLDAVREKIHTTDDVRQHKQWFVICLCIMPRSIRIQIHPPPPALLHHIPLHAHQPQIDQTQHEQPPCHPGGPASHHRPARAAKRLPPRRT
jgi:hypothetical protein